MAAQTSGSQSLRTQVYSQSEASGGQGIAAPGGSVGRGPGLPATGAGRGFPELCCGLGAGGRGGSLSIPFQRTWSGVIPEGVVCVTLAPGDAENLTPEVLWLVKDLFRPPSRKVIFSRNENSCWLLLFCEQFCLFIIL